MIKFQQHLISNMRTAQGTKAIQYLNDRGLRTQTLEKFGIGLALGKTLEKKALSNKKHHIQLGNLTSKYGTPTFTNSITIPLVDIKGQIVGYNARTLMDLKPKYLTPYTAKHFSFFTQLQVERDFVTHEYEQYSGIPQSYLDVVNIPKYKNTISTALYKKSIFLYNANNLPPVVKHVTILESYFNVMAFDQVGITNNLGLGGTALTIQQVTFLKKIGVQTVTLALDGDEAGLKGMERAVVLLLSFGIIPYIIVFPDSKDAMDLLPTPNELIRLYNSASCGIKFLVKRVVQRNDRREINMTLNREVIPSLVKYKIPYSFDDAIFQLELQKQQRGESIQSIPTTPQPPRNKRIDEVQEQRLKDSLDIVDVVEHYITVKKMGANLKAKCPFHNDTKPSMVINPKKQIFKCFVCGAGGDAIKFTMDYKKMNYPDTLKELARITNFSLEA